MILINPLKFFLILNDNHQMKYWLTHTFPVVFCLFIIVDKISQKFNNKRELYMLLMNIFLWIILLKLSLKDDKYLFNEMLLEAIWLAQYCSMFMYLFRFLKIEILLQTILAEFYFISQLKSMHSKLRKNTFFSFQLFVKNY